MSNKYDDNYLLKFSRFVFFFHSRNIGGLACFHGLEFGDKLRVKTTAITTTATTTPSTTINNQRVVRDYEKVADRASHKHH